MAQSCKKVEIAPSYVHRKDGSRKVKTKPEKKSFGFVYCIVTVILENLECPHQINQTEA